MIKFGNTFVNFGGTYLTGVHVNYNDIPPNTIRVKFSSGYTPTMGDTQTIVDSVENIWDIYKQNNNWYRLFKNNNNLLEVLGSNTIGITSMSEVFSNCSSLNSVQNFNTLDITDIDGMFSYCTSLTTVSLFNTSKVIYMTDVFRGCSSLTTVPLFDTSSVYNMSYMFYECLNVESGALALYRQASTQTTPPSVHSLTFYQCGKNTQTGAAELAQIPTNWKF